MSEGNETKRIHLAPRAWMEYTGPFDWSKIDPELENPFLTYDLHAQELLGCNTIKLNLQFMFGYELATPWSEGLGIRVNFQRIERNRTKTYCKEEQGTLFGYTLERLAFLECNWEEEQYGHTRDGPTKVQDTRKHSHKVKKLIQILEKKRPDFFYEGEKLIADGTPSYWAPGVSTVLKRTDN